MKKLIGFVISAVLAFLSAVPAFAEKSEYCSIVFELTSGTVIDEVNADKIVPVGTMNKLMTILLAAEKINCKELSLDTVVKVSEYANSMQGAQIWLMPGESISVEELLKGIIIGNANDASVVVAETVAGSEKKFVEAMNSKSVELGMKNTSFTNCCGYYDDDKQLSTASDMSKLICELSKYEFLTPYFTTWLDYVRNDTAELVNSNELVKKFEGIIGFKAGYTENSGHCIAAAARRDNKAFGVIILGADDKDDMLSSEKTKLGSVFADYIVIKPEIPENIPGNIGVRDSFRGEIPVVFGDIRNIVIPKGAANSISSVCILPEQIYAPVKKGDKVGEIQFYRKKKYLFSVDIIAAENAEKKTIYSAVAKLLKMIVLF
ncbi:MAG: D-alanyl-D-alanine carboxypeptidase family protein [Oscillospiraceae bacterium]